MARTGQGHFRRKKAFAACFCENTFERGGTDAVIYWLKISVWVKGERRDAFQRCEKRILSVSNNLRFRLPACPVQPRWPYNKSPSYSSVTTEQSKKAAPFKKRRGLIEIDVKNSKKLPMDRQACPCRAPSCRVPSCRAFPYLLPSCPDPCHPSFPVPCL